MTDSLFKRLGEEEGIRAVVEDFYRKILLDGRVSYFFDQTNMRKLYLHQTQFISHALGGPNNYKGKDLRSAHKNLVQEKGLNERHFDIVSEHLKQALLDNKVEQSIVSEILAVVASTKNDVLNK